MTTTFTHPELQSGVVVDALSASGFEVSPRARSVRTVLDTFDGRLHEAGLRLEARGTPTADLVLTGEGGAPPAHVTAASIPTWPSELPAGPFRERLEAVTKERALLPVLTITSGVRTARRLDRRGKATVVVEVNDGLAVAGRTLSLPSWVAEVVPVTGHADVADATVTRLASLGVQRSGDDLVTLIAQAAGVPLEGRSSSPTVPLAVDDEVLGAFRRVLGNLAATIEANLSGAIDDTDPEFLHEVRVAVRRTRSVLAQGKGVLPADVRDRFREGFGWLGQATGPARDLDVYVLGWDEYVEPLSDVDTRALDRVLTEVQARRAAAHAELSGVLQRAATRDLLDSWRDWLTDPDVEPADPQPIGPFVAHRIVTAQKKVLRDGRSIDPTTPAERLHDLRKDTKKLRYLLECFGGLFDAKPLKAFVSQLKALQDNLGEHQDAEVHLAQLHDLAHDLHERATVDTDALLAMGRLGDHLDRRRRHERDEFARRFGAYDTAANHKSLDVLLRPAASL